MGERRRQVKRGIEEGRTQGEGGTRRERNMGREGQRERDIHLGREGHREKRHRKT